VRVGVAHRSISGGEPGPDIKGRCRGAAPPGSAGHEHAHGLTGGRAGSAAAPDQSGQGRLEFRHADADPFDDAAVEQGGRHGLTSAAKLAGRPIEFDQNDPFEAGEAVAHVGRSRHPSSLPRLAWGGGWQYVVAMQDKVIVVTGASAGIGAALAAQLGHEGACPVLVARRAPELQAAAAQAGPKALAVTADVTSRAEVERVLAAAISRFGHVDVWVNNAGRGISRPVSQLTDDDFDEMMLVNVKSALYGMQVVLPHFQQRGRGHIINVSSMLGRTPFAHFRSAYSAAKHALNALTANLRMELHPAHPEIVVSAVHPGVVATGFGTSARHGGVDSRSIPGAQSADEVAAVIAEVIERPRADVYTRPGAQQMVVDYFAAPDMAAFEQSQTFGARPR
jgi:NADP-dependent 3-hydroxy acid dehydrogenase YdfG